MVGMLVHFKKTRRGDPTVQIFHLLLGKDRGGSEVESVGGFH